MMKYSLLILFALAVAAHPAFAQQDTVKSHELREVEIRSALPQSSFRTTAPQQTLSADQLERSGALQVSDAVKHFSGVQVKDYGGIGGLKTVSIRSLGAHYTAVAYDGIALSDYQTGQVDVGRFSLDNISHIRLTTSLSDDLLQPARNLSLGGLIQIASQTFLPKTRRDELKAGLRTGSWQLLNPFLAYSRTLGNSFIWNVSGEYLRSKGDYPFRMDGEMRRRRHSETDNRKGEANLTGTLRNGGHLSLKAYYYNSDRNIPGAVISNTTYSGESMADQTAFAQAVYRQTFGNRWTLLSNLKYSTTATQYAHQLYPNLNSRYHQREAYGNASLLYQPSERLSFAWANDGILGHFRALLTTKRFTPSRITALSALSGKYETPRFTLNVSGLFQSTSESGDGPVPSKTRTHISPSLGGSIQPLAHWPFRLRASYRNTYRLPTFADIYYSTLPNTGLKPENAHQFNVGGVAATSIGKTAPYLSISLDTYYNKVENKIMAIPTSSMALWSVQNYGNATIRGLDLNATAHLRIASGFSTELSGNYTRQEVLNEKKQTLRYTPRHSASALATLKTPWFDWNYSLVYCGTRFYNETPSPQSLVDSYADHGLSITKNLRYKAVGLHLSAECLNFTNRQYEVVHAYPMPGRSFRFGFKIIF
jgi:outer membrane cobalamin receptor